MNNTDVIVSVQGERCSGKSSIIKFLIEALTDFADVRFPDISYYEKEGEHFHVRGEIVDTQLSTEKLLYAYQNSLSRAYWYSSLLKLRGIQVGSIHIAEAEPVDEFGLKPVNLIGTQRWAKLNSWVEKTGTPSKHS